MLPYGNFLWEHAMPWPQEHLSSGMDVEVGSLVVTSQVPATFSDPGLLSNQAYLLILCDLFIKFSVSSSTLGVRKDGRSVLGETPAYQILIPWQFILDFTYIENTPSPEFDLMVTSMSKPRTCHPCVLLS